MNIIQQYEAREIERLSGVRAVPEFIAGDTVRVGVRVVEGTRERVQSFEGVVIARSNKGLNSNFTVRKISNGEGVERVFRCTHRRSPASKSCVAVRSVARSCITCVAVRVSPPVSQSVRAICRRLTAWPLPKPSGVETGCPLPIRPEPF